MDGEIASNFPNFTVKGAQSLEVLLKVGALAMCVYAFKGAVDHYYLKPELERVQIERNRFELEKTNQAAKEKREDERLEVEKEKQAAKEKREVERLEVEKEKQAAKERREEERLLLDKEKQAAKERREEQREEKLIERDTQLYMLKREELVRDRERHTKEN